MDKMLSWCFHFNQSDGYQLHSSPKIFPFAWFSWPSMPEERLYNNADWRRKTDVGKKGDKLQLTLSIAYQLFRIKELDATSIYGNHAVVV